MAVIPINPHGFRMFSYPLETLSSPAMQTFIQEWLSPDFHQLRFLPLAVLMLATFTAIALSPKRVRPGELLGLLALTVAALRSGRHIPLFALFAAPIFAKYIVYWAASQAKLKISLRSQSVSPATVVVNAVLVLLPAFVAVRQIVDFQAHPAAYEARLFPTAAVNVIQREDLAGPIFNDYNWGGYLIWKLYPQRQVFIDGRADVYRDGFIYDYMSTYKAEPAWRSNFDRFRIQTVLIDPHSSLAGLLRQEKGWRTVFEDPGAVVFSRD